MERSEGHPNREDLLEGIGTQVVEIIRIEQQRLRETCDLLTQPKDQETTQRIISGAQALADQLLVGTSFRVRITESNLPAFLNNLQNVLLESTERLPETINATVETRLDQEERTKRTIGIRANWGGYKGDSYRDCIKPEIGINLITHFGLLDGVRQDAPLPHDQFSFVAINHWDEITNLPERILLR